MEESFRNKTKYQIKDILNTIICGEVLSELRKIPDESIDMICTSPPYYGLRDYGTAEWKGGSEKCDHKIPDYEKDPKYPQGTSHIQRYNKETCYKCGAKRVDQQLGLEKTLDEYLEKMSLITQECKRILKKTGTMWWNHGDCYSAQRWSNTKGTGVWATDRSISSRDIIAPKGIGLNDKTLVLQNYRLILDMVYKQGWYLRNIIIWHKPNCMPSSVKDRFTVDFEPVFFLTKSNESQYWVNEKTGDITDKQPKGTQGIKDKDWEWRECSTCKGKGCSPEKNKRCKNGKVKSSFWEGKDYWFETQYEPHQEVSIKRAKHGLNQTNDKGAKMSAVNVQGIEKMGDRFVSPFGRNKRCVWKISAKGFSDAHFAVFPEALISPMIKAGCPEMICKKCGKAREKIIESEYVEGYTSCGCNADWNKGIVLDPFMGSGTTGLVAKKLGRNFIGIELNPKYVEMANKRIQNILL